MKKYLFVLFLLICFSFSSTVFSAELRTGLSDSQKAVLETLPKDQRESIIIKMRQAETLESELEDTFEGIVTVVARPERRVLTEEEEAQYLKESRNWIFGYEQFQTSPTTFAPSSSMPIPPDFILGPGDMFTIEYYGNENISSQKKFISRSGQFTLPLLGPVTLAGLTFKEAQELVKQKAKKKYIQFYLFEICRV